MKPPGRIESLFNANRSLLQRALLANVTLAVALSALITTIHLATAKDAFRRQVEIRARSLAAFISAEAAYPMLVGDEERLRRIAKSALGDEDVQAVSLKDLGERISVQVERKGARRAGDDSSVTVRSALLAPTNQSVFEWDSKPAEPGALGSVEVTLSRQSEEVLFARTILRGLLAGIFALALIIAIQFVHFKRLFSPLETLTDFVRQIGNGDLRGRAEVVRRDEIGTLAMSFNEMVDRLSTTTVSRDYVDSIVRSMGDALLVTDKNLHIRTANCAAESLLGMSEECLRGRPIVEILGRRDLFEGIFERPDLGAAQLFEEVLIGGDGRRIPALLTASVLTNKGSDAQGLVCLAQDITDRKRVQEALVSAKEAAEESNRAKSNFLSNMSHELRTPLNAIINYSEMLLEDAQEAGRGQDAADLTLIRSSGKHLLALINDVLDLSKIEAGRMQVHLEPVEIHEVLSEVSSTCSPVARKNSTELSFVVSDCATLHADQMKLKQILINLVGNACKFTQNGRVSVRVYRREGGEDPQACFEVQDTGDGISAENLSRLFKSFTQVDGSHNRKYGGTGLGLAISQRLATLMGGRISVTSTLGSGSTFTLEMPADAEAIENATASSREVPRTVLIVDEDPRSLGACLKAWSGSGYALEFATTAGEAVRKSAVSRPFLVAVNQLSAPILKETAFRELLGGKGYVVLYNATPGANAGTTIAPAGLVGDTAGDLRLRGWRNVPVISLGSPSAPDDFRKVAAAASGSEDIAALMASLEATTESLETEVNS